MSVLKDQRVVYLFCDILTRFIKKIDVIKEISVSENDCDRSYNTPHCVNVIDKKHFSPCKDIQWKLNLEKFHKNCCELSDVLESLISELQDENSFDSLTKFVDECASKWINYNSILKTHRRKKQTIKNLEYVQDLVKHDDVDKPDDSEEIFFQWKIDFYQNVYDIKLQKKFQLAWIQAQINQNDFRLNAIEHKTKAEASNYAAKKKKERKAADKIQNFYNLKVKELDAEVKRMSAEYDKQIDEVEFRYQIAAEEKKRFQQMLDNEMNIFAQREQELKDFIAAREKKAADEKLRELQEVKAVKLQSWWRGEMVRQFKGPFKFYRTREREVLKELEQERQKARNAPKGAKKKKQ